MVKVVDQRRSRRYATHLPVDLMLDSRSRRVEATNVSRHGLFVESTEPPPERFVLQVILHLPDGPLTATAFVTRQSRRGMRGAGLQFFTMSSSAKARWDYYIYWLANRSPFTQATGPTPLAQPPGAERASFLVKLDSIESLRKVHEHNFPLGTIYLATPLLHRVGELVSVILIHPQTEEEFILLGAINRVRHEPPGGVEIRLEDLNEVQRESFARFVNISPEAVPIIGSSRPRASDTGDLMLEIAVGEPVETTSELDWDALSDDLIIDLDFSGFDQSSEVAFAQVPGISADSWPPPSEPPGQRGNSVTIDLPAEPVQAIVRCDKCGRFDPPLVLGEPHGPLGLVSAHRFYWSGSARTIVSILRIRPAAERLENLDEVGGIGGEMLKQQVPLALAFQVASLADPPACPISGQELHDSGLIARLEEATHKLVLLPEARVEGADCPRCGHEIWFVQRA